MSEDRIKASVIGLRGHAGLHIDFIRQNPNAVLDKVYYNRETPSGYESLPITNSLSDCLTSDVIIISTPTASHFEYMELLSDYPGYIFLEKPAVNSQAHISALIGLPAEMKRRIRVNFNFAFHPLGVLISKLIGGGQLGKVFGFDVHTSHGVAFREDWDNTWRVDNETGLGPLETTGIHYIQFSLREFGDCTECHVQTACLSDRPSAVDTGLINMNMADGPWVRIRHSYASPYAVRFELWGSDGYLTYDGKVANLHHPRDTFDENGRYTTPPLKETWEFEFQQAWSESLVDSQNDFLGVVRDGRLLEESEFNRDVSAMGILLDNRDNQRLETP